MTISEILSEEGIEVDLQSNSKEDVIKELVQVLDRGWKLENIGEIQNSIFEREKLSSTGICNSLAIPHAKVNGIKKIICAIGLSKKGIDFQAMDHVASKIFFVIISPKDDHGSHVKTLAKVTKILKEEHWREELLNCNSAKEVLDFIKDKEQKI